MKTFIFVFVLLELVYSSGVRGEGETSYFALRKGNMWTYNVTAKVVYSGLISGSVTNVITGAMQVEVVDAPKEYSAFEPVIMKRTTDTLWYEGDQRSSRSGCDDILGWRDNNLYEFANRWWTEFISITNQYSAPVLNFKSSVGSHGAWDVGVAPSGGILGTVKARTEGFEDVTVPAGTFKNCLKLVTMSSDISGPLDWGDEHRMPLVSGSERITSWLAKGVGVVKEVWVLHHKGAGAEHSEERVNELKPGYSVRQK